MYKDILGNFVDKTNSNIPSKKDVLKFSVDLGLYSYFIRTKKIQIKIDYIERETLLESFITNLELDNINIFNFTFSSELDHISNFIQFGMAGEVSLCVQKITREVVVYDRYETEQVEYIAPNLQSFLIILAILHKYDLVELRGGNFSFKWKKNIYNEICKVLKNSKYESFYKERLGL